MSVVKPLVARLLPSSCLNVQGVVSKDVTAVVGALKARGVTSFASVGWCWGASMAVQAAAADPGSFKATAFLHPSMFGQEKQLVAKLKCPLATFSTPGGGLLQLPAATLGAAVGSDAVHSRVFLAVASSPFGGA